MQQRPLGRTGRDISAIGLGTWQLGADWGAVSEDDARAVLAASVDHGVTLFDTADVYGDRGRSEEILGAALKGRRDDVVIATKFGMDMGGANGRDWGVRGARRYIMRAVESSLRRLDTDWIDLYQMHVPDAGTPIEETLSALHDLVQAGKVRYIGHSNFAGWQIADAAWTARQGGYPPFISAQNQYSWLHRQVETEVVPACQRFGLGLLPYFPLASGLLTGKYRRGEPAPAGARLAADRFAARLAGARWDAIEALDAFAEQRGLNLLDVAIGGLAAQPTVASVIAGATRPEQVHANVAAGAWEPTADDLATLDEITKP